jgi:uncharacterized protein (UPF0333 family)
MRQQQFKQIPLPQEFKFMFVLVLKITIINILYYLDQNIKETIQQFSNQHKNFTFFKYF